MKKALQRIVQFFRPQSIYILVAYDEESERFSEIIPVSSLESAHEVADILRKTYGGRNVSLASRNIDDIPYLIKRRLLVNEAVHIAKTELSK